MHIAAHKGSTWRMGQKSSLPSFRGCNILIHTDLVSFFLRIVQWFPSCSQIPSHYHSLQVPKIPGPGCHPVLFHYQPFSTPTSGSRVSSGTSWAQGIFTGDSCLLPARLFLLPATSPPFKSLFKCNQHGKHPLETVPKTTFPTSALLPLILLYFSS